MRTYASSGFEVRISRAGEGGERLRVEYTDERKRMRTLNCNADENDTMMRYLMDVSAAMLARAERYYWLADNSRGRYADAHRRDLRDIASLLWRAADALSMDVMEGANDDRLDLPAWRYLTSIAD